MKKISLMILSLMLVGTVGHAKVTTTNEDENGSNGVEAVDLGLSVKWANMNVGAEKDSGFGYYSWNTYVWSRENTQFLVKYSITDRKTQLDLSDDAARANWGGDWRMPTVDECDFRFYDSVQFRAINGIYWTSTLYTASPSKAWCIEFNFTDVNVHYGNLSSNRFSGRCIRAVKK